MSDAVLFFKCRWPEETVPKGEPLLLHFEVTKATDVVTRTVATYPDGDAIRNSIELSEREGPDLRDPQFRSLVHGPFLDEGREDLIQITKSEFDRLWKSARDKPLNGKG